MAQDLRGFLEQIKQRKPDDLLVISREVDPAYEITALVVKLEREARRRPVLLFEKVKGSSFPVLTNLHASRSRLAAAMGCAPGATLHTYLRAMQEKLPPKLVPSGPVKQVVLAGERVDLRALPQIVHHEGDAGEEVAAFVVLHAGARVDPRELVTHCRERLAGYKYPRQVTIVPGLPKSAPARS